MEVHERVNTLHLLRELEFPYTSTLMSVFTPEQRLLLYACIYTRANMLSALQCNS